MRWQLLIGNKRTYPIVPPRAGNCEVLIAPPIVRDGRGGPSSSAIVSTSNITT